MAERCSNEKRIIIIAGPNGAGKTTFAREYLPVEVGITTFINADLIAAGLSPFAPELAARRAGRLMLEEIDRCGAAGMDFAFETTLAAIRRVAERVAQGGHSIPPEVIRRRFVSGLRNFTTLYQPIVDAWQLIDNGGATPHLITQGGRS